MKNIHWLSVSNALRLACLAALATLGGNHMTMAQTRPEARAMWVVRYDLTSPEAVRHVIATAKKYNFNTLIVQVRGRGDAYYLNGLEPRSESLASQPETFDPLQMCIDLGHAEGMQIHAWLNTFYLWGGAQKPKSPMHVVNAHPEWVAADRDGKVYFTAGENREGAYMDPANPEARKFIHDVFVDVATRYNVDGIHFDYVRYPNKEVGFNDGDLERFKALIDPKITPEQKSALAAMPQRDSYTLMFPAQWAQFRRDCVTDVVRSVYRTVKKMKPNVAVSAALIPWGTLTKFEDSDAYNSTFQDWFGWMREGILDIAVPMTYHTDPGQWASWIGPAVKQRGRTHIWGGIGDWLLDKEGVETMIKTGRTLGAQGTSLFAYNSFVAEKTGEPQSEKGDYLVSGVWKDVVSVPDWRKEPPAPPVAPGNVPKPSDIPQDRW